MSIKLIEREVSAVFVASHGGLIDGKLPFIHEEAYMSNNYEIVSCEQIINKDAYKVIYKIENDATTSLPN